MAANKLGAQQALGALVKFPRCRRATFTVMPIGHHSE